MGIYGNIVFLIFLVLKLVGVIDWSWWLVCLPVIIPLAIHGVILALVGRDC